MKKKYYLSCLIVLMLICLITLTLSTSRQVKAVNNETIENGTLYTLKSYVNSINQYTTVITYKTLTGDNYTRPYLFKAMYGVNGFYSDNTAYDYFENSHYFTIDYRTITNGDYKRLVFIIKFYNFDAENQYYKYANAYFSLEYENFIDSETIFNKYYISYASGSLDDFEDRIIYNMLLSDGFYIVKDAPIYYNNAETTSASYDDMDYQSDTYFMFGNGDYAVFNQYYSYSGAYSNGFSDGLDRGESQVLENPSIYDLYTVYEYTEYGNARYQEGLEDASETATGLSSILHIVWDGASGILNAPLLGKLKVIHAVAIPLVLGLFLIILKLIRG